MLQFVVPVSAGGAGGAGGSADSRDHPEHSGADEAGAPVPSAIVGGREFVLGGWGAYEADRRAVQWELERRPYRPYYAVEAAGPEDAVRSLVTGGSRGFGGRALKGAAARLQLALGALEDQYCSGEDGFFCATPARPDSLTIPPLTAADLRAFLEDPESWVDPVELYELGEAAGVAAAGAGAALPALPRPAGALVREGASAYGLGAPIPVDDDEAVMRLEASVAPRVAELEALQAAVATRLDRAAAAIEGRLVGPRASAPRGAAPA